MWIRPAEFGALFWCFAFHTVRSWSTHAQLQQLVLAIGSPSTRCEGVAGWELQALREDLRWESQNGSKTLQSIDRFPPCLSSLMVQPTRWNNFVRLQLAGSSPDDFVVARSITRNAVARL